MNSARVIACLFIIAGCALLVNSAYDQHRGVASATAPGRSFIHYTIFKSEKPDEFRGLIAYEWIRAFLTLGTGALILGVWRGADQLDPFSPRFVGSADLQELERSLDEQQKRRNHQ